MAVGLTQVTRTGYEKVNRASGIGVNNYWDEDDPTKESDATGIIPGSGVLTVRSNIAATLTIRIWCEVEEAWDFPGSASADFTKTFAGGSVPAIDYFIGPPGAKYHIKSSVASNKGHDNGLAIPE